MAENPEELSMTKGDTINVTNYVDNGWWAGECNGRAGLFPANYVETIDIVPATSEISGNRQVEIVPNDLSSGISSSSEVKKLTKPSSSSSLQTASSAQISKIAGTKSTSVDQVSNSKPSICSDCGCADFSQNVFKQGHCNNCFHKH